MSWAPTSVALDSTYELAKRLPSLEARLSAEDERFELPDLLQSIVFKTTAIDHSANLPSLNIINRDG